MPYVCGAKTPADVGFSPWGRGLRLEPCFPVGLQSDPSGPKCSVKPRQIGGTTPGGTRSCSAETQSHAARCPVMLSCTLCLCWHSCNTLYKEVVLLEPKKTDGQGLLL